jgi:hypothetical protein
MNGARTISAPGGTHAGRVNDVISLGARYVDYGLTGGLFLFVGMAVFGWVNVDTAVSILKCLQKLASTSNSEGFGALFTGIFTSFFVVCIFATGLLLDLVGSLLIYWELDLFRKQLERNKGWVGPLLEKYSEFLHEDVKRFLTVPPTYIERMRASLSPRQSWLMLTSVGSFRRIENILLSHLLITVDRARIEFVMDQLRTCRIARAVSSGICLLVVLGVYAKIFIDIPGGNQQLLFALFVYGVLLISGVTLSGFIVRSSYSKYCSSLFASLFVVLKTSPT